MKRISETTRYLSAHAALDHGFANNVIERSKRLCKAHEPNYGVDMGILLIEAKKSNEKFIKRNFLISIIAFSFAIIAFKDFGRWHWSFWDAAPLLALSCLISGIITFYYKINSEKYVAGKFGDSRPYSFEGDYDSNEDNNNVVVYSGLNPFVGSGNNIGGWVLAIDLKKINEPEKYVEFDGKEVEEAIIKSISAIDIHKIFAYRTIFAEGKSIRGCSEILANPIVRPAKHVGDAVVNAFLNRKGSIRTYCQVRIHEWMDQLIVSILFRSFRIGDKLVIEANYFVLHGLSKKYEYIDKIIGRKRFTELSSEFFACLFLGAFNVVISPLKTIMKILGAFGEYKEKSELEKEVKENPLYDYGIKSTMREEESSGVKSYFQMIDRIGIVKIVEKEILSTIVNFLEERGVDTSELKERQTSILNNGIIISGGNVNANGIVAGNNASSTIVEGARNLVGAGANSK
ncbi:hypothetical protein E6C67_32865 [Azospirillum sp. TSA2s]|uniref:hypothetical protein n=1 Tax=Azospirillum sp. TSA2s TaxID=709810 RepID=UPI0010AA3223|nr:hypothetical protein [Azospirillum sp. TSA2s]QCG98449.1 hypothetical protein E6C67_32865 [Azospirillum sp. TSA2s]